MKISLCIITLNEQENLRRCLKSALPLVDEIIVVDSGSRDGTKQIAVEFGAKWIVNDWSGYVAQKNYAISRATQEWVFSIDADEALSADLLSELLHWKNEMRISSQIAGFSMPRCVFYEGRWIRHGDWYPDRLVRLFRKNSGNFEGGKVHERLVVNGEIVRLKGDLEHYSFDSIQDHRDRCGKYAKLWAESKHEAGASVMFFEGWIRAWFRFVRGFFLRFGFLDGWRGLIISWLSAKEVAMKYKKLRALKKK